jgi:hypothetical protein
LIVKESRPFGSHLGHMRDEIFFDPARLLSRGGLRKIRKKSGSRRELFTRDERKQHDALQIATQGDA